MQHESMLRISLQHMKFAAILQNHHQLQDCSSRCACISQRSSENCTDQRQSALLPHLEQVHICLAFKQQDQVCMREGYKEGVTDLGEVGLASAGGPIEQHPSPGVCACPERSGGKEGAAAPLPSAWPWLPSVLPPPPTPPGATLTAPSPGGPGGQGHPPSCCGQENSSACSASSSGLQSAA